MENNISSEMTELEDAIGEIINKYESDNSEFVSDVEITHIEESETERPKAYVAITTKKNCVHDRVKEKRIKEKLKNVKN